MIKSKSNYIFIRGLTRGNIHWGDFRNLAIDTLGIEYCEFLEIPGNGENNTISTPIDPKEVVQYLRNESKFIKNKSSVKLCGISLGGMIALKWLEIFPNEVEHVFMINSSLVQLSKFYHRLKPSAYFTLINSLIENNFHKREDRILAITSNNFDNRQKYCKIFGDFSSRNPVSRKNFFLQLILASKIRIEKIDSAKVTLLYSENDRLVDKTCSESMISFFHFKSYIHSVAGHDLPLDDPQWLMDKICSVSN